MSFRLSSPGIGLTELDKGGQYWRESISDICCKPQLDYMRNKILDRESPEWKKINDFRKGTTTLAFVYQGGIMVAVDSRASMGSYISSQTVRKIIPITEKILGTMAGGAADCSYWHRYLGKITKIHEARYNEEVSVASASKMLSSIFLSYKGYGLSCATMIAGYDSTGPHLYMVDDNGSRIKHHILSVGSGSTYAYGVLDSSYNHDMSKEEALELAKRAIYHATHKDGASGGLVRVYHVGPTGWEIIVEGECVSSLHYRYAAEKGMHGTLDE